jgi:SAM-dependent methyltransferase
MADAASYRAQALEQERIADLMTLVRPTQGSALDMGAADGYLSRRLAERFPHVVAVDLCRPNGPIASVQWVQANGASLPFKDRAFDTVLCSEVLEHVPATILDRVARELVRVCRSNLVIGVPYRQELRLGRTTCRRCGTINPSFGHINRFDESALRGLFSNAEWLEHRFVGTVRDASSTLATQLLDYAGNPFGTYDQEEPCMHCGAALVPPDSRTTLQRIATRAAAIMNQMTAAFAGPHGNWIHVRLQTRQ